MDRESNDWDIHMGFIYQSVYDFSPACIVLHSFQGIYQHRPPLRILLVARECNSAVMGDRHRIHVYLGCFK